MSKQLKSIICKYLSFIIITLMVGLSYAYERGDSEYERGDSEREASERDIHAREAILKKLRDDTHSLYQEGKINYEEFAGAMDHINQMEHYHRHGVSRSSVEGNDTTENSNNNTTESSDNFSQRKDNSSDFDS